MINCIIFAENEKLNSSVSVWLLSVKSKPKKKEAKI